MGTYFDEQYQSSLMSILKSFTEKIDEISSVATIAQNTSELLKAELNQTQEKVKELELKIDDQEQRSRNACLLFHGIDEDDEEDTDRQIIVICSKHLNIEIDINSITRSHRLGPIRMPGIETRRQRKEVRARPIIVRFNNFRERQKIFSAKKRLKGKRISVTENLTKMRMELLKKANTKFGKGNCWTQEGRIFTKINGSFIVISSDADL